MTFPYCTFCHGRGCLACEGERKKYEAAHTAKITEWHPPTEEDLLVAKSLLHSLHAPFPEPQMTKEALETRLRIPPPVLTLHEDPESDEEDLERANGVIGRDALQKMMEEAEGDPYAFRDKFLEEAEAFRMKQSTLHDQKEK